MLLKTNAAAYLLAIDPADPAGRPQCDSMIEMVREWTRCPKPNLSTRAGKLLPKMEAIREAALELRVEAGISTTGGMQLDVLANCVDMAKSWKLDERGLTLVHVKALELFVKCN